MSDYLYDQEGNRKYLNKAEREAFLQAALDEEERERRTFCEMLHYSGGRISEVLAVTAGRIDLDTDSVTLESLKKRQRGIFRTVPLPALFVERLELVHGLKQAKKRGKSDTQLWAFSRTTAWRIVRQVMQRAGVTASAATPKGLRHGFGVAGVTNDVPLNMVQKWLGHTDIATTAIYTNAIGEEERQIAQRMWR